MKVDEIGQEPRHDLRLPPRPRGWLTAVGVAVLVAAVAVYGVSRLGGRHGPAAGLAAATASSSPAAAPLPRIVHLAPMQAPAAAAGTVVLGCDSAVIGNYTGWQAGSLRVGPLWIVGGRSLGYVRAGRAASPPSAPSGQATGPKPVISVVVQMLVHINPGAAVVMRAAAGTWPGFSFLNSPASTGSFQELDGGLGYTFLPCPAADTGYGTGFYQVGFSIVPGHTASVEVWTSPSARPVWLTFSAPKDP